MKKIIFTSTLLFSMVWMTGFHNFLSAHNGKTPYHSEVFPVDSPPVVEASLSSGEIEVIGHEMEEVRVTFYVKRGRKYLEEKEVTPSVIEVDIVQDGDVITVDLQQEPSGGFLGFGRNTDRYNVLLRLYVPHESHVSGKTKGGRISANSINGNTNLKTSGGRIEVEGLSGEISLNTSGGSISMKNCNGTLSARTSGGSISLEGGSGEYKLRTSGGGIRLEEISGLVDAKTSGGMIRADIVDVSGDISLKTSGGNINIVLPSDKEFSFDLKGNRVNVDLENFAGYSESASTQIKEKRRYQYISENALDGAISVTATTSGGSVTVKPRK